MRYLHFIIALFAILLFTSCAIDILEIPNTSVENSGAVSIIGRASRFDDRNVDTRGVKDEDESNVTSMAIAIFPVNDNGTALDGDGKCVFFKYSDGQPIFTIERGDTYAKNKRYAIYIFANIRSISQFNENYGNKTLADMLHVAASVDGISIPKDGFPMIGSLGDTFNDELFDIDGKALILSPTVDGSDTSDELAAPRLIGPDNQIEELEVLTVPLKAMYAKINFTIQCPTPSYEVVATPQFELNEYTVRGIPASVDFDKTTNSDTDVLTEEITVNDINSAPASGSTRTIKFSFYLPERYLTPATPAEGVGGYDYKFPEVTNPDTDKNSNGIRDEDEPLRQRFKGKLLGENQKATNVVISGRYRDLQGHSYNVDYTIHLGWDNYSDFNIIRNIEYNNFITINGILNSSDNENNSENANNRISVDHRVHVERTQPAIISLRREMMLDSHFEIRPLRIKHSGLDDSDLDGINAVKVSILNATGNLDKDNPADWLRLEHRNSATGTNSDLYLSNGKRKYFTYNLVNGLNTSGTQADLSGASLKDSYTTVVPLNAANTDGECVWIYVDECTEVGDDVRTATIQVTYGTSNGDSFTPTTNIAYPPVNYVISQRKLFEVEYGSDKYYIEYEEEYLHNFDSDDEFGQTHYEGMEWGLNGVQLSSEHPAIDFGNDLWGSIQDAWTSSLKPNYDFYVQKHDASSTGHMHNREGYNFSKEIISKAKINILDLNSKPESAVEYCYNKNKRFSSGEVVKDNDESNHVWYLPSIDQIEDIVMSKYKENETASEATLPTYVRFLDFQYKFYWSSQPSYIRNYAYYYGWLTGAFSGSNHGDYYTDDTTHARATRVNYVNGEYFYESSGVVDDTYFSVWYHYDPLIVNTRDYTIWPVGMKPVDAPSDDIESALFTVDGDDISIPLEDVDRQLGNKPRTGVNGIARVRCVRLKPTN